MHHRRCYASVCTLNGKIYALGGNNGIMRLRSAEVYCPKTNQWTLIASMNRRRSDADACAFNDRIYITGSVLISIIFTQNDPKKTFAFQAATMVTIAHTLAKFTMLQRMNGQRLLIC